MSFYFLFERNTNAIAKVVNRSIVNVFLSIILCNIFVCLCYYSYVLFLIEQLAAVAEFASLGPLFKSSSKPIQLTESETEYVVNCVKHTFANHMVFQVSLIANLDNCLTLV